MPTSFPARVELAGDRKTLTLEERRRLVRSTRKLGDVLGTTPHIQEIHESSEPTDRIDNVGNQHRTRSLSSSSSRVNSSSTKSSGQSPTTSCSGNVDLKAPSLRVSLDGESHHDNTEPNLNPLVLNLSRTGYRDSRVYNGSSYSPSKLSDSSLGSPGLGVTFSPTRDVFSRFKESGLGEAGDYRQRYARNRKRLVKLSRTLGDDVRPQISPPVSSSSESKSDWRTTPPIRCQVPPPSSWTRVSGLISRSPTSIQTQTRGCPLSPRPEPPVSENLDLSETPQPRTGRDREPVRARKSLGRSLSWTRTNNVAQDTPLDLSKSNVPTPSTTRESQKLLKRSPNVPPSSHGRAKSFDRNSSPPVATSSVAMEAKVDESNIRRGSSGRVEMAWSGDWNMERIEDVIKALRELRSN
ncbi:hypothetical protein BT96DRAFT_1040359 [Gymnopus androsaceus JB14]|uniref:Uncharacterized protein n=1 Tax=Gymnopus androsaceus JB14 TaxID=1447944 RepID=A0A6A4HF85_9AGAR|nr:hypothetical protein BT96DRAFT_1040359 [Gymnopus androsaceus JB14]